MTTANELTKWLLTVPNVIKATPCTVTIRGTTYQATKYVVHCHPTPGARNQTPYDRTMIYCLGNVPRCTVGRNAAFRIGNTDLRDWYIAGYFPGYSGREIQTPTFNEFHPFGNSFMLACWDTPDQSIDQYERAPYRRHPVTLTMLA